MPKNLVYPFNCHSRMKDAFFKDLQNWELGKSATKDLYMYYHLGVLQFMDRGFTLFNHLYEHASPDVEARLEKLHGSDETVLYFLPFYNFRLLADFMPVAVIADELKDNSQQAVKAYVEILKAFSIRVLVLYGNFYNMRSDDVTDLAKDVVTDYYNYIIYSEDDLPKGKAEVFSTAEGVLVSKFMEKFLATDDEETRFFLNLYLVAFSSNYLHELCKVMRPYYVKVWEIKKAVDNN